MKEEAVGAEARGKAVRREVGEDVGDGGAIAALFGGEASAEALVGLAEAVGLPGREVQGDDGMAVAGDGDGVTGGLGAGGEGA